MSHWESAGKSNEWYTPKYIFDALGCKFDMDVASPPHRTHVPCDTFICRATWLDKFFQHGNGIALVPDRTSAPWWQDAAKKSEVVLFTRGKVKFERPDGSIGESPSTGTTLMSVGKKGNQALVTACARDLGVAML